MRAVLSVFICLSVGFLLGQKYQISSLINPQDPSVLYAEAFDIYQNASDKSNSAMIGKAIDYCDRALAKDPEFDRAHQLLAIIYSDSGQCIKSLNHWYAHLELQSHNPDMQENARKRIKECVQKIVLEHLTIQELNPLLANQIESLRSDLRKITQSTESRLAQSQLDKDQMARQFTQQIQSLENQVNQKEKVTIDILSKINHIQKSLTQAADFPEKLTILGEVNKIAPDNIIQYAIQPGDSLAKLAHQFKTSLESICLLNDISDPHRIAIGQKLFIPEPKNTRQR